MAGVWQNLFGENEGFVPVPKYNPQTQQLLDRLIQSQSQGVLSGQGQQGLNAQKQQAMKNFETSTVPTIANRFLSGGTGNSSGFQNALGSSAADLELGLQQLQDQYGNQQMQNLLQLLSLGGQEQIYRPQSYGLAGDIVKNIPRAAAAYSTGGISEGGNLLSSLAQLFPGSGDNQQQVPSVQKMGPQNGFDINQLLQLLGMSSSRSNQGIPGIQSQQENRPLEVKPQQNIQSILQNLGTPDVNKLRQQNMMRGLKPLYNLGI